MMNTSAITYISFLIAKLSILLGMACNGSSMERVRAQKWLWDELQAVYPLLDDEHIESTAKWLGFGEQIINLPMQMTFAEYSFPCLDKNLEEIRKMDCPVFMHPLRSPIEILTELYVYCRAALIANPLFRKYCRTAANYYIDFSGTSPRIFMAARASLNIERQDIDRWFSHKNWVMQIADNPPKVKGRQNAYQKL